MKSEAEIRAAYERVRDDNEARRVKPGSEDSNVAIEYILAWILGENNHIGWAEKPLDNEAGSGLDYK